MSEDGQPDEAKEWSDLEHSELDIYLEDDDTERDVFYGLHKKPSRVDNTDAESDAVLAEHDLEREHARREAQEEADNEG